MAGRSDEEIGAHLRALVAEGEDFEFRTVAFHESIRDYPGPVGVLLRQIAHAHNSWDESRRAGGTTEGEETRLLHILDDAMALVEQASGRAPAPAGDDAREGGLTERQRQILSYVSHGCTTAEIAAELFVAEDTVKTHIGRVLRTLKATDRAHAVRIGFEEGLLVPAAQRRPRVPRSGGRRAAGGVS